MCTTVRVQCHWNKNATTITCSSVMRGQQVFFPLTFYAMDLWSVYINFGSLFTDSNEPIKLFCWRPMRRSSRSQNHIWRVELLEADYFLVNSQKTPHHCQTHPGSCSCSFVCLFSQASVLVSQSTFGPKKLGEGVWTGNGFKEVSYLLELVKYWPQ